MAKLPPHPEHAELGQRAVTPGSGPPTPPRKPYSVGSWQVLEPGMVTRWTSHRPARSTGERGWLVSAQSSCSPNVVDAPSPSHRRAGMVPRSPDPADEVRETAAKLVPVRAALGINTRTPTATPAVTGV